MSIYMITHKQRWLLQECRNIYYYETASGDPTSSEWQDIVDEIRAEYVAELQGSLSDEWEFYGIDYRRVDVGGLPSFSAVPTAGIVVGTVGTDTLPTQIAALVSVKANTTKPNHARTYFPGMADVGVVNGLIGSTIAGHFEDFIDYQTTVNGLGTNVLLRVAVSWNSSHTMVVDHNSVAGSIPVCSRVPATQRRRRIGVGI